MRPVPAATAAMIATVDPASLELSTFELPENALPHRLGVTSDDIVQFGTDTNTVAGE